MENSNKVDFKLGNCRERSRIDLARQGGTKMTSARVQQSLGAEVKSRQGHTMTKWLAFRLSFYIPPYLYLDQSIDYYLPSITFNRQHQSHRQQAELKSNTTVSHSIYWYHSIAPTDLASSIKMMKPLATSITKARRTLTRLHCHHKVALR